MAMGLFETRVFKIRFNYQSAKNLAAHGWERNTLALLHTEVLSDKTGLVICKSLTKSCKKLLMSTNHSQFRSKCPLCLIDTLFGGIQKPRGPDKVGG